MINPNDVNLIIFDLGGTIINDSKADYEAVRRAFLKLGWKMPVSEADYLPYIVLPSDDFYRAITPPEYRARWQEAREKVRQEYYATFMEFSTLYPGAVKTLQALKNRGYRLALYSRAISKIVVDVAGKLALTDYFVYLKNSEDDSLDKYQLAGKIIDKFNATAAIVGDSIQDIEVARETNSLSIGVLYGYGGKEPEKADITINRFEDLLDIFKRNNRGNE